MSLVDEISKMCEGYEENMPRKRSSRVFEVELEGQIVDDLELRLRMRPFASDEKLVGSVGKLKMSIYANDHMPPHFHVDYNGESNIFRIDDGTPLHGRNLKKFFPVIKDWHAENKGELMRVSNQFRPAG